MIFGFIAVVMLLLLQSLTLDHIHRHLQFIEDILAGESDTNGTGIGGWKRSKKAMYDSDKMKEETLKDGTIRYSGKN